MWSIQSAKLSTETDTLPEFRAGSPHSLLLPKCSTHIKSPGMIPRNSFPPITPQKDPSRTPSVHTIAKKTAINFSFLQICCTKTSLRQVSPVNVGSSLPKHQTRQSGSTLPIIAHVGLNPHLFACAPVFTRKLFGPIDTERRYPQKPDLKDFHSVWNRGFLPANTSFAVTPTLFVGRLTRLLV